MNAKRKLIELVKTSEPGPIKFKDQFYLYAPFGNSLEKPTTRHKKNYFCSRIITLVKFQDSVNISFVRIAKEEDVDRISKLSIDDIVNNDNVAWGYGTVQIKDLDNLFISDNPHDFNF